jgi:hypothetical protein
MKANGQITWQDFLQAYLLHYRPGILGRVILTILIVLLGGCGAYGLTFAIPESGVRNIFTWCLPFLGILVAFGVFRFMVLPLMIRNMFTKQKHFSAPFTYEIDETTLNIVSPFHKVSLPLGRIEKWKEDKRLILLYTDRDRYQILPKRIFANQSEIDTLKSWLHPEVFHQNNVNWNAQMVMLLISISVIALIVVVGYLKN